MKKCKKCGVPLEGFMYKLIALGLFGVKPSLTEPDICNKCEGKPAGSEKKQCGCGCDCK